MMHPIPSTMKAPGDYRRDIWRGGVLQVKITNACDLDCKNCSVAVGIAKKLKKIFRMTPDQFRTALRSLKGYTGVIGMFGGNPSLRKGTRVYTTAGIFPIEDLEGRLFQVRNLRGNVSQAMCRLSGKDKPLFRIKLKGGHEYFATAEHEWPAMTMEGRQRHDRPHVFSEPRKLKTTELQAGMWLPIPQRTLKIGIGRDGSREEGFLIGWMLSDGWLVNRRASTPRLRADGRADRRFKGKRCRQVGLIVNDKDRMSGIGDKLTRVLSKLGSDAAFRAVKTCHELQTSSTDIDAWLECFGVTGKADGLPLSVWTTASDEFRIGLLDAMFSADGHQDACTPGFSRVGFTTAHEQMARDVSDLLGFYGIKTSVSIRRRTGCFPNGKDYRKEYTSCEVRIAGTADVQHFMRLVSLTHAGKREAIKANLDKHKPDVRSNAIQIVSVEPTELREDVWDISVADDTHCFQLAHCITGNCIHPKFETLCQIMQEEVPDKAQRGLWSNRLFGHGAVCRETFNPEHSNLNVHGSQAAYNEMVRDWPESEPLTYSLGPDGVTDPSKHGPIFGSMTELGLSEDQMWEKIGSCYVNQTWSAEITVVDDHLVGYFCEVAATMAELQGDASLGIPIEGKPELGVPLNDKWWKAYMPSFADQVNAYCTRCLIPLNGKKVAASGTPEPEQYSPVWAETFAPLTVKGRAMAQVTTLAEITEGGGEPATKYLKKGVMRNEE